MKRSAQDLIEEILKAHRVGAITQFRTSTDTFISVLTLEKKIAHKVQFEVRDLMNKTVMEKLQTYISDTFEQILHVATSHTTVTITYTK